MNSFEQIDPKLIDVLLPPSGYPDELAAEDTPDALRDVCGAASREFPESLWIDPKDWADKARENDRLGTWPVNYSDRFTNQDPNHFCTCHSLATNFEIARNRARAIAYLDGPKKDFRYEESASSGVVWVSPMSIYAEANPREWGGANVRQVLEIAVRRGFLPDTLQPAEYGFRHSLAGTTGKGGVNQSRSGWVSVSRFPAGWQETAKLLRPLEVIFPSSYEQAVCMVLNGIAVSVGRNGHAVPWVQWMAKEQSMKYQDSYDIFRYDSLRTVKTAWQGSFGIASTTLPDDWSKPGV